MTYLHVGLSGYIQYQKIRVPSGTRQANTVPKVKADRSGFWEVLLEGRLSVHVPIPAGVAIANCPICFEASPAEYPDAKSDQDLLEKAKSFMNKVTEVDFSVDGVKLENVSKYIVQSPVFDFALPKNNVLGILPPQSTHGVAYGIFVVLPPLPPGNHVIHSKGTSVDFTEGSPQNFVSDVTYHLTVKP